MWKRVALHGAWLVSVIPAALPGNSRFLPARKVASI
jgi:hypothetical protein